MTDALDQNRIAKAADETAAAILRAAASWAAEAPPVLTPPIRAVCVRLAEMVADQRHYLAPLPEPQASERRAVLTLVAHRLRTGPIAEELAPHLQALAEMELRATGSWSVVAGAQNEWQQTAIDFLANQVRELSDSHGLDEYWADDVVCGIIASVKGVIGADDLYSRIEAQYAGKGRPRTPQE
ncbi:MAG: hypothetical protein U0974_11570 [Gemmatimonadales bacterium]|jgi:hypothetical protein|nr:hypothetical protein [Gemmatimonadales bacterium]MDZ4390353.1 hypothetical protein [Gemmatimonadales bacterium]